MAFAMVDNFSHEFCKVKNRVLRLSTSSVFLTNWMNCVVLRVKTLCIMCRRAEAFHWDETRVHAARVCVSSRKKARIASSSS